MLNRYEKMNMYKILHEKRFYLNKHTYSLHDNVFYHNKYRTTKT